MREQTYYTLKGLRNVRSEYNPSLPDPENRYRIIDEGEYLFMLVEDLENGISILQSVTDGYLTNPVHLEQFIKIENSN